MPAQFRRLRGDSLKARSASRNMKVLGIIARIVLNLVGVLIVLAMFDVAKSHFETVVVAGLVLIYVAIQFTSLMVSRIAIEQERMSFARFLEIRTAVGQPSTSDEVAALRKLSDKVDSPGAGFYITAAFLSIYSLMALFELVSVVLP